MKKRIIALLIFFSFFLCLGSNLEASTDKLIYKDNKFIIKLSKNEKYNKSLKSKIEKKINLKIKEETKIVIKNDVFYSLTLDKSFKKYDNVKVIKNFSEIANVQPVYRYKQLSEASGKGIADKPSNWHVLKTRAEQLKEIAATNPNAKRVKVAVLDTGVDDSHPDLANVVDKKLSHNFIKDNNIYKDDSGHGTHVAGIIGATNDYSVGTNIDIVALRVLQYGFGDSDGIAKAIEYAQKNKIPIMNMSLGFNASSEIEAKDDIIYTALKNYDGLVVAAAGNSGMYGVNYPAGYSLDNIVSVSSFEVNGNPSTFTSYHKTKADIFAPGSNVYSTCLYPLEDCKANYNSDYKVAPLSGTSMATPVVTGILATTLSLDPTLSTSELKDSLIDSAIYDKKFNNKVLTNGYIDAVSVYDHAILKIKKDMKSFATINVDGSIDLWGKNNYGQLGDGSKVDRADNNKFNHSISNEKIVKYYINSKNIYLVTDKGNLYVSGDNSFGQLGQTNSNSSTSFVKFIKANDKHEIKSLSFRNKNGLYDENSLKIELKNTKNYYKLGNNSFVIAKDYKAKTDKLQYVTHSGKGVLSKIYFYDKNSRKYTKVEERRYEKIYHMYYDEDDYYIDYEDVDEKDLMYTYQLVMRTITDKSNKSYYLKDELLYNNNDYDEYDDEYSACNEDYNKRKVSKYSYKNTLLKRTAYNYQLTCTYNYEEEEFDVNRKTKNKETVYYKNKKKDYAYYYKYNSNGKLKGNKYNYASKQKINYNKKGKLTSKKIAHYNSKGKLSKYRTNYVRKESKNKVDIKSYTYNYSFNKLSYVNKKYVNNKKSEYLVYKYKNNVKSTGSKLKYNSKGQLRGKPGDYATKRLMKYNKKGELVSKKLAHYNKKGKKTKYQTEYLKAKTKQGYNVKKYTYKYKMIKDKMTMQKYVKNRLTKLYLYDYNKYGKLKSTSNSQATLKVREYKNNKLFKVTYYSYDQGGNKYLAYYQYV